MVWGNEKDPLSFYFILLDLKKKGTHYFGNKTKRFFSACNKNADVILNQLAISFRRSNARASSLGIGLNVT